MEEKDREQLQGDVFIDKYNLDEEVVRQVDKFVKWAELHVESIDRRDRAKNKLELIRAQLDTEIRSDPDKFKITGRVTENSIESAMVLNSEYQSAQEEWLESKKESEILAVAREAMMQRKSMLNNLVTLNMIAYYGDPEFKEQTIRKAVRQKTE